jgi:putative transposase
LRDWLRCYAKAHPRWGHRRAYHAARAYGWMVNHKKVRRLWRQEGLCVRGRRQRKRAGSSTYPDVPIANAPNVVWAIDFQYDSTTDGRPIKILSAIDEHTRECLGGLVKRSITAERLAAELDRIVAERGTGPRLLRLDNGPEMIAAALAEWAGMRTGMVFIPPGEPWRNSYIESFNGRLRDECLNMHQFWSLTHAQVVIGDWKHEYNWHRPHSALGYQTPAAYAADRTRAAESSALAKL